MKRTKKQKKEWNLYTREYRKNNGNKATIKYEKTINGFLMRLYRNMKSRVNGIQKDKYHLYKDLKLLSKEDFYSWSKNSIEFKELYYKWVKGGYNRKETPSVDRINSKIGYELENMEWVTHSENSRRGALSLARRRYSPNYNENYRS